MKNKMIEIDNYKNYFLLGVLLFFLVPSLIGVLTIPFSEEEDIIAIIITELIFGSFTILLSLFIINITTGKIILNMENRILVICKKNNLFSRERRIIGSNLQCEIKEYKETKTSFDLLRRLKIIPKYHIYFSSDVIIKNRSIHLYKSFQLKQLKEFCVYNDILIKHQVM